MTRQLRVSGPDPWSPNTSGARVVTATETAKNFGAIIARVREERAVYVVQRSGTPVAEIRPVQAKNLRVRDFVELLRSESMPPAGEEYLKAVEEGVAVWNRAEVPSDPWGR